MTIESLLTQRCEIDHILQSTTLDQWGQPETEVAVTDLDVPCRIQRRGTRQGIAESREILIDRDTSTSEWKMFLLPDQAITELDVVREGDRTFEVVGHAYPVPTPFAGIHHKEALLRLVTG